MPVASALGMTPLVGLVALLLCGGSVTLWTADAAAPSLLLTALSGPCLLVVSGRLVWAGHTRFGVAAAGVGALLYGVAQARAADLLAWHPPGLEVAWLEQQTLDAGAVHIEGKLRHDAAASAAGATLDLRIDTVHAGGRTIRTDLGARLTVGGAMAADTLKHWTRGRRITAPVASLRRPLPYRNFGVPDAERELARRRIRLFGSVKSAALVEWRRAPWWEEAAAAVRRRIRESVRRAVADSQASAVVIAILIGDRTGLAPDDERRMQRAGTYHVIAISGGNVALWLGALAWLPRWRRAGVRPATAVLATGLLAFAWCVDGGASVARASCVAALWLLARWWDLRAPALQVLAGAAALIVLSDPLALHDAGFLLSFGATLALVLLGSFPARAVAAAAAGQRAHQATNARRRAPSVALAAVLVVTATFAVELLLAPIGARWFGLVTGVGLVANLAALPAMAIVQAAGLLVVALDGLGLTAACQVAAAAATAGVSVLLGTGALVDHLPWLVRHVPPPPLVLVSTYYLLLAMALLALGHPSPRRAATRLAGVVAAAGATAALALIVVGRPVPVPRPPWSEDVARVVQTQTWPHDRWLRLTMLDVGQGDATLLQFPSGRAWLVDTGGAPPGSSLDLGARVTAPALWALGVRRFDRLIVTHGDADHAGGAPAVIERFVVREVMAGVPVPDDPVDAALMAAAVTHGVAVRLLRTGERFAEGGVHVRVLHPPTPDWTRVKVRNDDSVALWVRYGEVGVLLPGDAGAAVEDDVCAQVAAAPLTIVRAGHHGSRSSTGQALLDHFRPALVVASAGRGNRFGHPHPDVVRRAGAAGARVRRTDEDGAVQLTTNGRVAVVRTAAGEVMVLMPP